MKFVRNLFLAWIFFFGVSIAVFASASQSETIHSEVNIQDSGGTTGQSVHYRSFFQSAGLPVYTTSTSNQFKLISGPHFSTKIKSIFGYNYPFQKDVLTDNVSVVGGTMTSKIQFMSWINGVTWNLGIDTQSVDGWGITWDTRDQVNTANAGVGTADVRLLARAWDGLSWGPWYLMAQTIHVDNEWPSISNPTKTTDPISPDNITSVGIQDSADFSIQTADSWPNKWTLSIVKNAVKIREFSGTNTQNITTILQTWDGRNSSGNVVEDGVYGYQFAIEDMVGHVSEYTAGTIEVDNTSPASPNIILVINGSDINSGRGSFEANWSTATPGDIAKYAVSYYAGEPINATTLGPDPIYTTTWSQSNLQDLVTYNVKVIATDRAGNTSFGISNSELMPDRTAPIISDSLVELNGTEDINWISDITAYKLDSYSQGANLRWDATIITKQEDPINSSEEVLKSVDVTNGITDTLAFVVSPNANTAIFPGNIYGKDPAYIRLKLTDESGNYASKDIRIRIAAVNDPPEFIADIGSTVVRDQWGHLTYSFKIDENTQATANLDSFVRDIDNVLTDLTWTVTSNPMVTANIGGPETGHLLTIVPTTYWYGDAAVTVSVTDNSPSPTNSVVTQSMIVRVWPVNQSPIVIDGVPGSVRVDEDTDIALNLHDYKDDIWMEDKMPTYSANLKWSVVPESIDSQIIDHIFGENQPDDVITIVPKANAYGTTNITLKLTDTDEVPRSTFADYMPDPKSTTRSVTLVFVPVNDPPEFVSTFNMGTHIEDGGSWTLNLLDVVRDVEDLPAKLHWNVSVSKPNLVAYSIDQIARQVTFTPAPNAWGTADVQLAVSDSDDEISFSPYVPNPKTVTESVKLTLLAVNDPPTISGISFAGTQPFLSGKVFTTDTLTVTVNGYSDVGYDADVRNTDAIGDEYGVNSIPDLNYIKNQKLYGFTWKVNGVTTNAIANSVSNTSTFVVSPSLQGKSVSVTAWPYDGIVAGNSISSSVTVNTLPSSVVPAVPLNDTWWNTPNMTVGWNYATDADSDPVKYRIKLWKYDDWQTPPPTIDINADVYYDSGWFSDSERNKVDPNDGINFLDGTYFWAVWAANKFGGNFGSSVYDLTTPNSIISFHVDTIAPELPSFNQLVGNRELSNDPNSAEKSGKYQLIYGRKGEYTSVWLESFNEIQVGDTLVTSYNFYEIVPTTSASLWTYQIFYPEGRTTYNIYLADRAKNYSSYYSFVITDDITPPMVPDISGSPGLVLTNGVWAGSASQNSYTVTGIKEDGSSIYYNGVQAVGFVDGTTFSFKVYSTNCSGNILSEDRAGNRSASVSINISFIQGAPSINILSRSADTINLASNLTGLSSDLISSLSNAVIQWVPGRDIASYKFISGTSNVAVSGTNTSGDAIVAGVTQNTQITATTLTEGLNTISLKVTDNVGNTGIVTFPLTRKTIPPVVGTPYFSANLTNGKWEVWIIGQRGVQDTILVNNSTANVSYASNGLGWYYKNLDFDLANLNIVVTQRDIVYNQATANVWNKANYGSIASQGGTSQIIYPYTSLPANILRLQSTLVKQGQSVVRSASDAAIDSDSLFSGQTAKSELIMHPSLRKNIYQIYGVQLNGSVSTNIDLSNTPISIGIPYQPNVEFEPNRLVPVKYNPQTDKWESMAVGYTLDPDTTRLNVQINSTGIWGLAEEKPFAESITSARIYPNPWRPSIASDSPYGIMFDQLTSDTRIRIYTVSGQLVRDFEPKTSYWTWDGTNDSGRPVFSGVYIYILTDSTNKKMGKLTIIR